MKITTAEIEERLHSELGLDVAVEEAGDGLLVTGYVPTVDDRIIAVDFVRSLAEGAPVADIVDVGDDGRGPLEPGDFTDQATLSSPDEASGPSGSLGDKVSEGDIVYVPPVDPVATNDEVLNGLALSSHEGRPTGPLEGEELADVVRRALKLDSLTTGFPIQVEVDGNGTVILTGVVGDVQDASYAESVAGGVPGVEYVEERLTISNLPHEPGEHRPGEEVTPSGRIRPGLPVTGRESLDAEAREIHGEMEVQPNDEHAGGGRPYGSDEATLAWDGAQPRSWGDLLDWLEHPAGLAEAARAAMVEDARILRDSGEPLPADGGDLFDALMRAHTMEPPPPPPMPTT